MGVPQAIAVIDLALSAVSMGMQHKASQEAKEIAERNAQKEREFAEEAARRAEYNAEKEAATAKLRLGATGVTGESHETYLEDLEEQQQLEIEWIRKSGKHAAEVERMVGSRARTVGLAGVASTGASAASNAYNWFSNVSTPNTPASTPTVHYI
jgi:tryptophan 2,3-dioxygenase